MTSNSDPYSISAEYCEQITNSQHLRQLDSLLYSSRFVEITVRFTTQTSVLFKYTVNCSDCQTLVADKLNRLTENCWHETDRAKSVAPTVSYEMGRVRLQVIVAYYDYHLL